VRLVELHATGAWHDHSKSSNGIVTLQVPETGEFEDAGAIDYMALRDAAIEYICDVGIHEGGQGVGVVGAESDGLLYCAVLRWTTLCCTALG